MGDPCHSGRETSCETKEQRQSVMSDGSKLGCHPQHVDAADVQVQRPVVLKTYQRRYSGISHKPVSKAANGRSGSTAELDRRRLTGTGSENGIVMRQPGDQKSMAANVGNLAALSQADEPILITPTDLADVQVQRPEVLLKTYQRRYSGSYKDIYKAIDSRSGSSVELGHQIQRLTGTCSENGTFTRQPDDQKSLATNVRNLTALSIAEESVLITPTGKSCDPQARPVKNNNNVAVASKKGGSNITQGTRHSTEAVRNGWTRPPTGFKQVWRPKEKTELPKELSQLQSKASKAKDKRQNTTYNSKSSSTKHKHKRSSKQNGHFDTIVLNDSDGTSQPVGYACCLCGNDLAYSPISGLAELLFTSCNLPDVAVLLCGHVFHMRCMQYNMSDEQLKDPQCFLCDNPYVT